MTFEAEGNVLSLWLAGQGSLKQFAEERLDLFRLTIKEFLNGK